MNSKLFTWSKLINFRAVQRLTLWTYGCCFRCMKAEIATWTGRDLDVCQLTIQTCVGCRVAAAFENNLLVNTHLTSIKLPTGMIWIFLGPKFVQLIIMTVELSGWNCKCFLGIIFQLTNSIVFKFRMKLRRDTDKAFFLSGLSHASYGPGLDKVEFLFCRVNIGLFCSTPGVALARAVPRKLALEMLFTGNPISAERKFWSFILW